MLYRRVIAAGAALGLLVLSAAPAAAASHRLPNVYETHVYVSDGMIAATGRSEPGQWGLGPCPQPLVGRQQRHRHVDAVRRRRRPATARRDRRRRTGRASSPHRTSRQRRWRRAWPGSSSPPRAADPAGARRSRPPAARRPGSVATDRRRRHLQGPGERHVKGKNYLYAADFHQRTDRCLRRHVPAQTWSTRSRTRLPRGYAPFGIQNLNGMIFVTYAKQDADKEDEIAGRPSGFVSAFDRDGTFLGRVASRGALERAVGPRLAPAELRSLQRRPARRQLRQRPDQRATAGTTADWRFDGTLRKSRTTSRSSSTACGGSASATAPAPDQRPRSTSPPVRTTRPTAPSARSGHPDRPSVVTRGGRARWAARLSLCSLMPIATPRRDPVRNQFATEPSSTADPRAVHPPEAGGRLSAREISGTTRSRGFHDPPARSPARVAARTGCGRGRPITCFACGCRLTTDETSAPGVRTHSRRWAVATRAAAASPAWTCPRPFRPGHAGRARLTVLPRADPPAERRRPIDPRGTRLCGSRLDPVADAADRDDPRPARASTFARRRAIWGLARADRIRLGRPARPGEQVVRDDVATGPDERLEQAELGRRQVERQIADARLVTAGSSDSAPAEGTGAGRAPRPAAAIDPAHDRRDPGQQLGLAERLDQVVVGADAERLDLGSLGALAGDDEDRRRSRRRGSGRRR